MEKIKLFVSTHKKAVLISSVSLVCVLIVLCLIIFSNSTVHTVTFFSDDNSILKVDKVKENDAAEPPVVPELTYGNVFTKWNKDFSRVTSDLDIYPEYESVQGKPNTFVMQGVYGKTSESVTVPLMLCGDVKLSGFDAVIEYDPEQLTLESVYNIDGDVICNDKTPGKLKINFVSANNATADVDICSIKMIPQDGFDQADIKITVNSIYAVDKNGKLYVPEYNTVDASVFIYS